LRADLALWAGDVERGPDKVRREARLRLRQWQAEPDLAPLRDPAELAKLPPEERAACRRLWDEVEALRARALGEK
jgi:hypothetical protein